MKAKKEEFGYIKLVPVKIVKKDDIIRPFEQRGLYASRVGKVLSGKYKNELVIYKAHTEERVTHNEKKFVFVPTNAVLSLVELEEDEEIVDIQEIKQRFNDPDWIDAMDGD